MNWNLVTWTWIVGGIASAAGVALLAAPAAARRAIAAFPRHAPSAWVLTGLDLAWVAAIVFHASLGRFDSLKPALYVIVPACFFLLVQYLDELLAPRALGGLLLLAPNPILNAARWHPSDARFVMTVLAYAAVVAGILLVLGPYRFRRWAARWIENDARCRAAGVAKLVVGFVLCFLAYRVYPV